MFPSNLKKSTNFPNMAGVVDCDVTIARELEESGIPLVKVTATGEVPYHVEGRIQCKTGEFTFARAWYYYRVHGLVPLGIARELHATEIGKRDIRVAGNCGCPEPDDWAVWYDDDDNEYSPSCVAELEKTEPEQEWHKIPPSRDIEAVIAIPRPDISKLYGYVDSYHVDSQAGLNLLVKKLEEHGLLLPIVEKNATVEGS
jgi:hypothetical protein